MAALSPLPPTPLTPRDPLQRKKAVQPEPGKEGGLIPVEGAIHYSNVALVDPSTQ